MKNDKRFQLLHAENIDFNSIQILLDTQTGVQYLLARSGGLTPLLDKDGKPVITPIDNNK
jgi:hypothetical protein